jgi:DNA repair photolyase
MKTVTKSKKEDDILSSPLKHTVISTRKQLHGWHHGKRECTGERMLINPYNGCSIDCFFCYGKALPGHFQKFRKKGIITVCDNFDRTVAKQLDSINVACAGYLSPVTDPFQKINEKYKLSQKIIREFISRNIPMDIVTKAIIPEEVIQTIKGQKHSLCQVSILTPHEKLQRTLVPNGAAVNQLFKNINQLAKAGIHAVCRIDPVLPYITDREKDLTEIIRRAAGEGAKHIIASSLDIPLSIRKDIEQTLRTIFGAGMTFEYNQLYKEFIDGHFHAHIDYRNGLFELLRSICDKENLTFALCMEYELKGGKPVGMNRRFMSSVNCEGIDVPVYIRNGDKFEPAANCSGACLTCTDPECGIGELAMGIPGSKKDWKLSDYRRWSKELKNDNKKSRNQKR